MNCDFLLTQSSIERARLIGSSNSSSSVSEDRIKLNYMFRASYTQELEHRLIVFEGKDRLVA
jgi:hypothetical protein